MAETVADGLEVQLPKQALEPARRIGNLIAVATVFAGTVLAFVQPFTNLVPGEYHGQVSGAIAVATGVVALVTRLSAELIRGKVTPYDVYEEKVHEIFNEPQARVGA